MNQLKIIILIIGSSLFSFLSFSQLEVGAYSEVFSGKFIEKNSFTTTKNHLTIGGGIQLGIDLPKKFQLQIGVGYNRYVNVYENSEFEKEDNFKNENYETKTTLNTTLNGFYYLDYFKINIGLQYPIIKIKERGNLFAKVGVSFSELLNGYEEFHLSGSEKGNLFYQDSVYPINDVTNRSFIADKNSFDYPNSINLEILMGLGINYNISGNHSFFSSIDLTLGMKNQYFFNDKYEHYTNTTDVTRSRGLGLKFGYSYRFLKNKEKPIQPKVI